ncbi:MAG: hypothetical protein GW809_01870 [Bacteroidetes bacterium]|nr:hypothetical protein [Bacteroidota bacterium]NCQ10898.1 hypothetical protein [Bacteroidota bacterium]
MLKSNSYMLEAVANGLAYLKEEMVFAGGAVAELYASNPEATDIRPTLDVDCVIEIHSYSAHTEVEDKLRSLGFVNDTTQGAPICRWNYQDILVDIMPSDSEVLGFSNRWYKEGIKSKILKTLPNGTDIFVFSPEYYLATKFEANKGRGGSDLRQSHDFEDIIYILDNCAELLDSISKTNETVKIYLKEECTNLLNNKGLVEGIESSLPFGSEKEATDIIIQRIQKIGDV